jgi:hypothetical protein
MEGTEGSHWGMAHVTCTRNHGGRDGPHKGVWNRTTAEKGLGEAMRRVFRVGIGLSAALAVGGNHAVLAQVPGLPVLQNAFSNPGVAFAANFGGSSGQSYYGAAAAWGLGATGAFLVSGAAGAQRINSATRGAYGGRASMRLWASPSGLGAAGFAGVGAAMRTRTGTVVTNPAVTVVPVGASIGYRRALGARRGISAFVSPFYRWARVDSGTIASSGSFRVSGGVDLSVTPSIGVTLGGEAGGGGSNGLSGSPSTAFGVGLTFVPRRR